LLLAGDFQRASFRGPLLAADFLGAVFAGNLPRASFRGFGVLPLFDCLVDFFVAFAEIFFGEPLVFRFDLS
jgi:hypothetical protein